MYEFNEKINVEFIELIKKGINICNDLNIPISKNIVFKYCTGITRFGYALKKDNYDIVFINKNIVSNDKIINTTIHELLHTIPNDEFKPHSGNWKKYADIVSSNTPYKITVTDNSNYLDYKKIYQAKFCFCSICGKGRDVKIAKIHNGKTNYYCTKHLKFLNNYYPDSIIKDMNEDEKKVYVTNKLNDKITLEEIYDFLPYTSQDLTHKIIKFVLNNFEWDYTNLKVIKEYARIDKPFLEELANEWCEGKYIYKVQNMSQLYDFEGTFALTKWWIPVTKYSKKVFSQFNWWNL